MPYAQNYDSTQWIAPWYVNSYYTAFGSNTTNAYTNNVLTAVPILVPRSLTIDRIGVVVTAAGDTAAKLRLGIYLDSGGLPGTLQVDLGLTTAITVAAYKEITIGSPPTLAGPGLFWLAAASENTAQDATAYSSAVTMRSSNQTSPFVGVLSMSTSATNIGSGYTHNAAVTAGLPGTFTAASGAQTAPFRVWVRCAS